MAGYARVILLLWNKMPYTRSGQKIDGDPSVNLIRL